VSERVTFGVFEFEPRSGTLTREGIPVRLQPQPARVLAILVSRPGEVVSREELRQQIWSEGTFVDFERGLNFCIAQIRSALKDAADAPRFIETIPRRGYRFVAPIRVAVGATAADPPSKGRRILVPVLALGTLAAATVILILGTWIAGTAAPRSRIAVVPFDNETGLDDFDEIARGVADAPVARLATPERVARLAVIGNAAALHRPRAFRDLRRIGTSLHADYIVLAQMKRDASRVRLIAHLIRVKDESHIWANTFDRPAFTLEVQAEIAEAIARAVVDRLSQPSSHANGNN